MIGRLVYQVTSSLSEGRIKFSVLYIWVGDWMIGRLIDQVTSSLGDGIKKFSVLYLDRRLGDW